MPVSEMPSALQSHRVDAVLPGEPFTTMMSSYTRMLGSQYGSMQLPFPIFGVFSTEQWLAAHADIATKFVGAIQRSATWSNSHHKETAVLLARLTKVDQQMATTMGRITYGTTLDAKSLQPIIAALLQYGIIDKPIDANDLLWQH
jgi:ABC-type nitrate/sulfonate/bicarbonate transport system substrate-binding protein